MAYSKTFLTYIYIIGIFRTNYYKPLISLQSSKVVVLLIFIIQTQFKVVTSVITPCKREEVVRTGHYTQYRYTNRYIDRFTRKANRGRYSNINSSDSIVVVREREGVKKGKREVEERLKGTKGDIYEYSFKTNNRLRYKGANYYIQQ